MSATPERRKGPNWKVLAAGLVVVLPLVAVLASGFGRNPRGVSNALEGRSAPDFRMETLTGKQVTLSEFRGRPVVLNFWATWCGPCKQEHPHLRRASDVYGDRVAFVGVLFGDEPENASRFLRREPLPYETGIDAAQRVAIDYGVTGVPETFFIDAQGNITRKMSEPLTAEFISTMLESML